MFYVYDTLSRFPQGEKLLAEPPPLWGRAEEGVRTFSGLFLCSRFMTLISENTSENKCMSIFHHKCPVKENRNFRIGIKPVQSPEIVVNKVEIVSFAWIITESEVSYQLILCIYVLNKYGSRQLCIEHVYCPHIHGMNIQPGVYFPVREPDPVIFIPS
jgi:hypothetical protein